MHSFKFLTCVSFALTISTTLASIALPGLQATSLATLSQRPSYGQQDDFLNSSHNDAKARLLSRQRQRSISSHHNHYQHLPAAMAIPGYGVAEQIFVGGFANFLQIYNFVITARVLLSWFPQAQGVAALQPVYAITDPYLNLFRGIIPPVFGLDLSPILAFFTLNVLTSATAAVGCEKPEEGKKLVRRDDSRSWTNRVQVVVRGGRHNQGRME